eukprot:3750689-Rhodomonas_salina.1
MCVWLAYSREGVGGVSLYCRLQSPYAYVSTPSTASIRVYQRAFSYQHRRTVPCNSMLCAMRKRRIRVFSWIRVSEQDAW